MFEEKIVALLRKKFFFLKIDKNSRIENLRLDQISYFCYFNGGTKLVILINLEYVALARLGVWIRVSGLGDAILGIGSPSH